MDGNHAAREQKCHLSPLFRFPKPPLRSMLQLVSREYFVLSDGDNAAKQRKRDMGNPAYWYTYEDLGSEAITVEDFYERTFFIDTVKKIW